MSTPYARLEAFHEWLRNWPDMLDSTEGLVGLGLKLDDLDLTDIVDIIKQANSVVSKHDVGAADETCSVCKLSAALRHAGVPKHEAT